MIPIHAYYLANIFRGKQIFFAQSTLFVKNFVLILKLESKSWICEGFLMKEDIIDRQFLLNH